MNEEQKSICPNDTVYSTRSVEASGVQGFKATCNESDIISVGVGSLIWRDKTTNSLTTISVPLAILGVAVYWLYSWFNSQKHSAKPETLKM
jgi:hypothetical protein